MVQHRFTNRLIHESSPYLQQHAHNPVDWRPWGDEAIGEAKSQNRPIFLSIGYATCHWCHVMEREAFDSVEVAQLLNENFICIKVDREELPQVDAIYMDFAQAMLGGLGGWPLNVMLTPDLKPFFAATYLPIESSGTEVGLMEVLERIRQIWSGPEREALFEQAEHLVAEMAEHLQVGEGEVPGEHLVTAVMEILFRVADSQHGGIQGAPKFPMAYHVNTVLAFAKKTGDSRALFYAGRTLDQMAAGGIYDHLGGGFARYTVDEGWLRPHFEKMLLDNGLLALAYLKGWRVMRQGRYEQVARDTLDYLLREMVHESGGFLSAEDADSEGQEGLFYTWTLSQVIEVLGHEEGHLFADYFGVTSEGNWEGRNILYQVEPLDHFAQRHGLDREQFAEKLTEMRWKMWQAREAREHPLKDDKVVAGWNGLAIRAFAEGGIAFGEERYLQQAERCARLVRGEMWREGRLLRRWREGEVGCSACIEDYAYLISGLLSLFEAGRGSEWLVFAMELARVVSAEFKQEGGPFYRTAAGDEHLILRLVDLYDGAEPSGNAVHCENLIRLFHLTGAESYLGEAEEVLAYARTFIEQHPVGGMYHLLALERYLNKEAPLLVVALDGEGSLKGEIARAIGESGAPFINVIWRYEGDEALFERIPLVREQRPIEGKTTLYLCKNRTCAAPTTDRSAILQQIRAL
ncbi:MAG: thioredoxin domain-containing protein [Parachlamydiales bacterium]